VIPQCHIFFSPVFYVFVFLCTPLNCVFMQYCCIHCFLSPTYSFFPLFLFSTPFIINLINNNDYLTTHGRSEEFVKQIFVQLLFAFIDFQKGCIFSFFIFFFSFFSFFFYYFIFLLYILHIRYYAKGIHYF
jgi:hypothetical protein